MLFRMLFKMKSVKSSATLRKVNGLTITNPGEISNELHNHFSTIGPKLASETDSDSGKYKRYLTCTDKRFHFCAAQPMQNKVFSLMNKLSTPKAIGLREYLRAFNGSAPISFCAYMGNF